MRRPSAADAVVASQSLNTSGADDLNTRAEVLRVLDDVLSLKGRTASFSDTTLLLGNVPELDSMAVASVITALEERFGFAIDDDELSGATFENVGRLVAFVESKTS